MRKLMGLLIMIIVALCSIVVAQEEEVLLKPSDVHFVMDQLLELHVDKHQVSPLVLERSFEVSCDTFDKERLYLLEDEISDFIQPSPETLSLAMEKYYDNDYSMYEQLNDVFQKAIHRARDYREEFFADRTSCFDDSNVVVQEDFIVKQPFAKDVDELHENLKRHWHSFYTIQSQRVGELNEEKKQRIVDLYLKRARDYENLYLLVEDDGQPLSPEKKQDLLLTNVLKSLAQSLDAHSSFFSSVEAYDMKMRLEKGFCGLGIVLEEGVDGITIVRLIEGGPADKSSQIQEDDTIISIDGKDITKSSFRNILSLIRGEKGSPIALGIKRYDGEDEEILEVVVNRDDVILSENRVDARYEPFGDGIIGILELHSFYEGANGISSEKDLCEALEQLRNQGNLKGIVLDLRENSGGFLQQAIKVAGLFITSGVVVMSKYYTGEENCYRDVDGYSYFDGPLVILTSKASASAAEIVAQTLQDYGVAIVVGDERTYGKGSIQHQTVTSGEAPAFFKVTVGRYYTVSGKSTQVTGVRADISVPSNYHAMPLGEEFLDYPLRSDTIDSAYCDDLDDVGPFMQHWFKKYYVPSLQSKKTVWQQMLPILQKNSADRVAHDQEYQDFLQETSSPEEYELNGRAQWGKRRAKDDDEQEELADDEQMEEAVNIVKDMIYLNSMLPEKLSTTPVQTTSIDK